MGWSNLRVSKTTTEHLRSTEPQITFGLGTSCDANENAQEIEAGRGVDRRRWGAFLRKMERSGTRADSHGRGGKKSNPNGIEVETLQTGVLCKGLERSEPGWRGGGEAGAMQELFAYQAGFARVTTSALPPGARVGSA